MFKINLRVSFVIADFATSNIPREILCREIRDEKTPSQVCFGHSEHSLPTLICGSGSVRNVQNKSRREFFHYDFATPNLPREVLVSRINKNLEVML